MGEVLVTICFTGAIGVPAVLRDGPELLQEAEATYTGLFRGEAEAVIYVERATCRWDRKRLVLDLPQAGGREVRLDVPALGSGTLSLREPGYSTVRWAVPQHVEIKECLDGTFEGTVVCAVPHREPGASEAWHAAD